MTYLNAQVGYPIVALSDLIPLEEFPNSFSTETRYLPKIMVEAGIVSSISEVRRNRPELCKMYPDNMTTCEEIKWGKKHLYVVVGRKVPINMDDVLKNDPDVHSWQYISPYNSTFYHNSNNSNKLCTKTVRKYSIPIVHDSYRNNILASGKEYCDEMIINYC